MRYNALLQLNGLRDCKTIGGQNFAVACAARMHSTLFESREQFELQNSNQEQNSTFCVCYARLGTPFTIIPTGASQLL